MRFTAIFGFLCVLTVAAAYGDDKPRVFITDSTSWETSGGIGGSSDIFGGSQSGGARPQTAEIIKTFGQRCPNVLVNNKQDVSDYVVVLDHEGGKSVLQHKNKIAVFNRVSGDIVTSTSTFSLGGSVQNACEAIAKHWSEHASEMKAAEDAAAAKAVQAAQKTVPSVSTVAAGTTAPSGAHVSVTSMPDGSDIEVDGSFVGNTPSSIQLTAGEHSVVVKKDGYKDWERKVKITGGDIKLNIELEKVQEAAK